MPEFSKDQLQRVDRKRYEASIVRLQKIFRDISDTVGTVSTWRCPYKDAQDFCTAGFGCRNQLHSDKAPRPICVGSDHLDYRSAWEV